MINFELAGELLYEVICAEKALEKAFNTLESDGIRLEQRAIDALTIKYNKALDDAFTPKQETV